MPPCQLKVTAENLILSLEIIKYFNENLKGQIIGCGAFYAKRVDKITAKHLALVQNSIRFILNIILPNIYRNILKNPAK